MTTFAFVFARGGSKGLMRKNLKELGGVPLVAHSIRVAQGLRAVSGVFVSTDCEQIAGVAMDHGAEVIIRPSELASDTASEWDAWRHAVSVLEADGRPFDVFVSLPATSPLRSVDDVEACLAMLDNATDVVVTVSPAARSPYFNMVRRSEDGLSTIIIPGAGITRRQDAAQVFDMTTVAYVTRPCFIREHSGVFDGVVRSVVIPKRRAIDIDDEIDFRLAELLYAEARP